MARKIGATAKTSTCMRVMGRAVGMWKKLLRSYRNSCYANLIFIICFFLASVGAFCPLLFCLVILSHQYTVKPRAPSLFITDKSITLNHSISKSNNFPWIFFFIHLLFPTIFRFPWDIDSGFNCNSRPLNASTYRDFEWDLFSIVVIICVLVIGRFYAKKIELMNLSNPAIWSTHLREVQNEQFLHLVNTTTRVNGYHKRTKLLHSSETKSSLLTL